MNIDNNAGKIWTYIWGQFLNQLQSIVIGKKEYKEKDDKNDVIWLLEQLKLGSAGIDTNSNKYDNLIEQVLTVFTMRQRDNESNDEYLNRFKSNLQTLELAGGGDFFYSKKLDVEITPSTTDEHIQEAKDRFKSCTFHEAIRPSSL